MSSSRRVPGAVPVPADTALAGGADPASEDTRRLRRAITPKLLLLFIVGDILGGGIYALVGEVGGRDRRRDLGRLRARARRWRSSPPARTPSWSASTRAPAAPALYVHRAFGSRFFTFMVAFAVMASGHHLGEHARARLRRRLPERVRRRPGRRSRRSSCWSLIALVNFRGIAESVKLNVGFTLVEVGGLLLIILIAAVALGQGDADAGRAVRVQGGLERASARRSPAPRSPSTR